MKNLYHKQIMLDTVEVVATAQSSWCSHNSHTTGTKCTRVCECKSDDESRSKSQMNKNGQKKTDTHDAEAMFDPPCLQLFLLFHFTFMLDSSRVCKPATKPCDNDTRV